MFSEQDLNSFAQRDISVSQVEQQIRYFNQGFPYLDLVKAAGIGDGILKLDEEEVAQYVKYYQQNLSDQTIIKFVPASGAASRMFKDFFSLMGAPADKEQYPKAVEALKRLPDFAFYRQLNDLMSSRGHDLQAALDSED